MKHLILCALMTLLWASTSPIHAVPTETTDDLKIWYTQPATGWLESLPLGNGRIGAMPLGGVAEERIILNEATLYSRESSILNTLPDITSHIDLVARMIKNEAYAEAESYATKHITGPAVPCYQPLGDIIIRFAGQENVSDYTRQLDLSNAVAKVNYKTNGTSFTREYFVSYPDNALIIRLRANQKGKLNFTLQMESLHPTTHTFADKKTFVFSGQLPAIALRRTFEWVEEWEQQWKYPDIWDKEGRRRPEVTAYRPDPTAKESYPVLYNDKGIKFETRVQILQCDGRLVADANGLTVSGAQDVVIAVALSSSFSGFDKDPVTEGLNVASLNQTTLLKLAKKSYAQLFSNHLGDYQKLFRRVSLQVSSPSGKTHLTTQERKTNYSISVDPSFAALYFQYGRYLLISSSREGGQPANLQGIWNVDIIPPWASAYTTNINMQMNYWAAESTNLSECHEPMFRFLKEASVTGGRVAQEMYKLPGWVLHHNSSVWRGAYPVDWYAQISFWPMGSGWLCRHLWQHFQYTKDMRFLRETAYPLMKGAAMFYNGWLQEDDNGYWVTPVSDSPENAFIYIDEHGQQKSAGMAMACTIDLAIIRELFQNVIDAENLLGSMNVDGALANELTAKLAKLYPYRIGKQGQFLEYYKEFIESPPRHNTSPYYPLYPGDQFTLKKNAEFAKAVRTLLLSRTEARPGGGGWPAAWYAALWARLGEGERALPYMEGLVGRTHLNLFSGGGNVFQIDANLGYTAAIAEMLLQSHSDEINLLPTLPDVWPSGSVNGLCAEGGFEVGMDWKEKVLTNVTIQSKTTNRVTVRYKNKIAAFNMQPGETIRLDANLNLLKR